MDYFFSKNTFSKSKQCLVYGMAIGLASLITLNSCGKEDDLRPALEDGKSVVVYDLEGDTKTTAGTSNPVDGKETGHFDVFLFRFKDKKQIKLNNAADTAKWLKTKDWDLAFTGPYNSEIYINNSEIEKNPGFGGEAKNTAIIKIDKPYSAVTEAPSDEEFNNSTTQMIGWNQTEHSSGWFDYSMGGHIMQAIPNRTYVLRLADGKYAKLELISAYKGYPVAITDLRWPAPYYTFRYFVQKDGSNNLNTQ